MGLVVVYGRACWRGSTVAVVILGLFLFVFEFGGLRIDGGREIFFFLSCFLNCFKLQMFISHDFFFFLQLEKSTTKWKKFYPSF